MADAPPPSRRPRWYQDLRWIMAGLMLVVASTTLYGLFGPDTPIVVSPATTVITEPLAADGLPALDTWLAAHAGRLDLLREASRRPRFYLPNPTLLRGNRDSVLSSGLHLGRPLRQAVTVLQLRAMGHLGHGRPTEAWRDILAMHRLARLASAADGGSVLSRLITVVLSGAACAATLQLLDAPGLPAEVAATISQDLEALPPFPPHAQMIALDRLGSAAFVIHACTAPRGKRREHFEHVVEVMDDVFAATSLDGNVILEDVNAAYAAIEQALRLPTWQARERELVRLDAGWQSTGPAMGTAAKLADTCRLLLNRGVRSGRIARRLNAVLCLGMASADATVTRYETFFELTRVAAALAACRAAGGTDYSTPIVAGERAEESPHLGDAKTTDVVVRLPLPGSPILERLRARP